jgi:hypothetical protein
MQERFGPGFYLYLGTRRGMKMFVEHRFVNLIWGLEAFDRRGRGDPEIRSRLQEKVERILKQVTAKKDKDWLAGQLQHAGEPNLAQRLYDLFIKLPLPLDEKRLRDFCKECAERRNDISHFGGVRREMENYDAFIRDLDRKSDALTSLYHLHLLSEIGVDHHLFDFKENHSRSLYLMQCYLSSVGILKA